MTTAERQLVRRTLALGAALCLGVAVMEHWGLLAPIERRLHDLRARYCQFFQPPPTDKLVHLDIDDQSLTAIGRWPWPRAVLAQVIDELRLAGVVAVGLDVIFPEPQQRWLPSGEIDRSEEVGEDDRMLAEAIARHGRVLVPMTTEPRRSLSPLTRAALAELAGDLEASFVTVRQRLRHEVAGGGEALTEEAYLEGRRRAMAQRIDAEMDRGVTELPALRAALLPGVDPLITESPLLRLLAGERLKALSIRRLRTLMRDDDDPPPNLMEVDARMPPILPLAQAAAATGFVDYHPGGDGVVRDVPLWVRQDGRLLPQMGLSLACLTLGVTPDDVLIKPRRVVVITPAGREIELPVRMRDLGPGKGPAGAMLDIPWFGKPKLWQTMYDYPVHQRPAQHMPVITVWQVRQSAHRLEANNASVDEAVLHLLEVTDPSSARAYAAAIPPMDDFTARLPAIDGALRQVSETGWVEAYRAVPAEERDHDGRAFLAAYDALTRLRRQNEQFVQRIDEQRASLRRLLAGKTVLVGWIATAATADFVPTSLHPVCPGVVVHGAVFNAVMTGHVWHRPPPWVNLLVTLVVGSLVVLAVALLSPLRASVGAVVVFTAYALLNGIVLFDRADTIVSLTAPMLAATVVWSGGTLLRFIAERAERARVTSRFRSYVDPALVNYVLEHPDRARLDGQVREMTVVFTDLAGFTTLSEKLRERTVPMLNEYMGVMVPIIRGRRGYVNKFLGDGIMFFFGAPLENPNHAGDAVATVLRMQRAMTEFNRRLEQRRLPTLKMRAGISTGMMVVGDAGSEHASDYTVLGDTVNLGARLESANKATGTLVLMSDRAAELVRDKVLLRPIGKLQVVGKSQGVMTFEPIATLDEATDEQRRLAAATAKMVEAFLAGDFRACLAATDALPPEKLVELYRELCDRYLKQPPGAGVRDFRGFDGSIVLEEK